MRRIGEYISQKRQEIGITQKQLAEELHVSSSTISKWETGVTDPHFSIYPQIAQILGVKLEELYSFSYEQASDNIADISVEEDILAVDEVYRNRGFKKQYLVFLVAIIFISSVAIGIKVYVNSRVNDKAITNFYPCLEVVDTYYVDDHDQYKTYGYDSVFCIAVEYTGELTDEFILSYQKEARKEYASKFEEVSLVLILFYKDYEKFDSDKAPDLKLVLLSEREEK